MRTTLTIDDDIFTIVSYIAKQNKQALGTVLSELARKGLQKAPEYSQRGLFPVFKIPVNAATITPEHIKLLDDEA